MIPFQPGDIVRIVEVGLLAMVERLGRNRAGRLRIGVLWWAELPDGSGGHYVHAWVKPGECVLVQEAITLPTGEQ